LEHERPPRDGGGLRVLGLCVPELPSGREAQLSARGLIGVLLLAGAFSPAQALARPKHRSAPKAEPVAAPAAAVAATPGRPTRHNRGAVATIAFVTAKGAYLNRGRKDGITLGMSIPWTRRTGASGTCRIIDLADHYSACAKEGGVRVGDAVTLPANAKRPT